MKLKTTLILLCTGLLSLSTSAHSEDWTPLFNGQNLDGWVQRGGKAPYTVENGEIVGTAVTGQPNSFLCTARDYDNFVLELEFKVDPRLNSGIQFRSHVAESTIELKNADGTPTLDDKGKPRSIAPGRVYGYQCEIDMVPERARYWTGGVYDEGRRLWLFPGSHGGDKETFTRDGGTVAKQGEWNRVRIEAVGTHIRTWINDRPRADFHDNLDASGFIGLQVHNVPDKPEFKDLKVRFRNIRIKPAAPSAPSSAANSAAAPNTLTDAEKKAGWRLLWHGRTTAGWRGARLSDFPSKGWEIKNGLLSVDETGGAESTAGGDIITVEKFGAFELSLDFKITPGANSGIKYYVDPELNKGTGSAIGLEFQILDDDRHPDAKLGRDGNRTVGSLYDLIPAGGKKVNPVGQWNTARIVSRGRHVEHWLNGVKVLEFERGSPAFRDFVKASKYTKWPAFGELPEGHILLQDHGNRVSFRNIKLRPLTAE